MTFYIKKITQNKFYLLLGLILILYSNTIFYGYIWDDFDLVITTYDDIIKYTLESYLIRPVMFLSYFISNYFFNSPIFDHTINLILYIFLVKLLYDFGKKYHKENVSFLILLVWICLPWMGHIVIWISQRNDTLMMIFSLLAIKADRDQRTLKSIAYLFLGIFSKITCFLLPLYMIFINKKNKLKVLVYSLIQLVFIIIGALSYIRGGTKLKHLSELNVFENIILKIFHVLEGLITQIIPLPYFFNFMHFTAYFILFIAAIYFMNFKLKRDLVSLKNLELIILLFIFILPLAINSELRVSTFSSYFLISLVFVGVISNRFSKIILSLYLLHNLTVTVLSKKNFYSGVDDIEIYYPASVNGFYNNNYYSSKRSTLILLKKNLEEKVKDFFE